MTTVDPGTDTAHRLTRKGAELTVRVRELPADRDGGAVLVFGEIGQDCLVRIHSRCLYGDALQSDDCDCGPELERSMDLIQAEGRGVLVYLDQEGRGAGLVAKARGLREAERTGADTFTAYTRLGYPEDARSFRLAAAAIAELGLRRVRLLTNNPDKAAALTDLGVAVTVVPLTTRPRSARARKYLQDKRARRRHWLPELSAPWAAGLAGPESTMVLPVLPDDAGWDEDGAGAVGGTRRSRWGWLRGEGAGTAARRS